MSTLSKLKLYGRIRNAQQPQWDQTLKIVHFLHADSKDRPGEEETKNDAVSTTSTSLVSIQAKPQVQQQEQQQSIGSSILSTAERLIDESFPNTSGRKRRRFYDWKRKRAAQQQRQNNDNNNTKAKPQDDTVESDDDDGYFAGLPKPPSPDTRTVMDLICPNPYKNEPLPPGYATKWPTTLSGWHHKLTKAWGLYQWTWRGFWASRGIIVEDPLDKPLEERNATGTGTGTEQFSAQTDEIIANVRRNSDFIKEHAMKVKETVQKQTGIETTEDMKRLLSEWMKLFSECVREFMTGYRKGRDDEVEKMLTEYFQNLEEQANKPKRRSIQPRVRNRMQMMIQQRYLRKCRR